MRNGPIDCAGIAAGDRIAAAVAGRFEPSAALQQAAGRLVERVIAGGTGDGAIADPAARVEIPEQNLSKRTVGRSKPLRRFRKL